MANFLKQELSSLKRQLEDANNTIKELKAILINHDDNVRINLQSLNNNNLPEVKQTCQELEELLHATRNCTELVFLNVHKTVMEYGPPMWPTEMFKVICIIQSILKIDLIFNIQLQDNKKVVKELNINFINEKRLEPEFFEVKSVLCRRNDPGAVLLALNDLITLDKIRGDVLSSLKRSNLIKLGVIDGDSVEYGGHAIVCYSQQMEHFNYFSICWSISWNPDDDELRYIFQSVVDSDNRDIKRDVIRIIDELQEVTPGYEPVVLQDIFTRLMLAVGEIETSYIPEESIEF